MIITNTNLKFVYSPNLLSRAYIFISSSPSDPIGSFSPSWTTTTNTFACLTREYQHDERKPNQDLLQPRGIVDDVEHPRAPLDSFEVVAALHPRGVRLRQRVVRDDHQVVRQHQSQRDVDDQRHQVATDLRLHSALVVLLLVSHEDRYHHVGHVQQPVGQQLLGAVHEKKMQDAPRSLVVVLDW